MPAAITPSKIESSEVYALDEFLSRVGWRSHAFRQAKRNGLRVIRFGCRAYVRGVDFLDFLDTMARQDESSEHAAN